MNLQISEADKIKPTPISYEDILSKMGMFVANGKLHLIDTNKNTIPQTKQTKQTKQINQTNQIKSIENSYIYNKYFKDLAPNTNTPRQPKTVAEYQQYLLQEIALQKIAKLRQLQYRKIIIPQPPTYNDVYSDPNKLFDFSKR